MCGRVLASGACYSHVHPCCNPFLHLFSNRRNASVLLGLLADCTCVYFHNPLMIYGLVIVIVSPNFIAHQGF